MQSMDQCNENCFGYITKLMMTLLDPVQNPIKMDHKIVIVKVKQNKWEIVN